MTPVDLSKPGRLYVLAECKTHRVYGHAHGDAEIERISDGATAFFHGDDALQIREVVETADIVAQRIGTDHGSILARTLDQYDTILAPVA